MSAKALVRSGSMIFGLLLTGSIAQADANLAVIEQIGDGHIARMVQEGVRLEARLYQEEGGNVADFQQAGKDNAILGGRAGGPALQMGQGNAMNIHQGGINNLVYASQRGVGNHMSLNQSGDDNTANLYQNGNGNQMTVTQMSGGNSLDWVQNGDNLPALDVTQTGGQSAQITQQAAP